MKGLSLKPVMLVLLSVAFVASGAAEQSYWHSNDYYAVEIDGEGEAFVVADIKLESTSDESVKNVALEIPYRNARVFKVAQETNTRNRYYRDTNTVFLDYDVTRFSESTHLNISLSESLDSTESTRIVVVYKTGQVAEKKLNGWRFEFETMKDSSTVVRKTGVDVKVPEGMHLKGSANTDVEYKPTLIADQAMAGETQALSHSIRKFRRDRNPAYKARNLDPGESFHVSGEYGSNRVMLYLKELALVVPSVLLAIYVFLKIGTLGRLKNLLSMEGGLKRAVASGAVSAVAFIASLWFTQFSISLLQSVHYESQFVLGLGLILLDLVLILVSLLGMPFYLGTRNRREGIVALVTAVILSIGTLVAFATVTQGSHVVAMATATQ